MRSALAACLALAVSACSALPTSGSRLTEAAYDVSTGMRFGRTDMVMERVKVDARADFMKRHAAWGQSVRIVEVELAGMDFRGKDEADVFMLVSWQKADESTMRATRISQRWKDDRGWSVLGEKRVDGDYGLFGDPAPKKPAPVNATPVDDAAAAAATAEQARFKTRVIYEE
ncbi:MAG: hypothetical protein WKG00_31705 [Polyangiaceae bacterium]